MIAGSCVVLDLLKGLAAWVRNGVGGAGFFKSHERLKRVKSFAGPERCGPDLTS